MNGLKKQGLIGKRATDLTGYARDYILVTGFSHTDKQRTYWTVRCKCGKIKVMSSYAVKKNMSCGCLSKTTFINHEDKKVNKITIGKYIGKNKYNCNIYNCLCDCGKEFVAEAADVLTEKIKTCGCGRYFKAQQEADYTASNSNAIYIDYKKKAEQRDIDFNISIEEFRSLIFKDCSYCGMSPSNKKWNGSRSSCLMYNGLDRVDNSKGYSIDNCVPACYICNQAKHRMTLEYFKSWIERIKLAQTNKIGIWNEKA
jgi:hypothetical protein